MILKEIYFEIGGYGGNDTYRITVNNNSATLITTLGWEEPIEKQYSPEETRLLLNVFEDLHVGYWNSEYIDPFVCVCDGTQWELAVKYKGQRGTVWVGSNAYPGNWDDLLSIFGIDYEDDEDA